MSRFAEKVIILTGAAGGIGAATARRLAGEKASLVLADRDADGLNALADELAGQGAGVATLSCDVGDEHHMDQLIEIAKREFGRVDAGILNAGIEGRVAPIDALAVADFDLVMRVNVRSVFVGLRSLLPLLKANGGGSLVVTASTAAVRGTSAMSPYVAAKHAVLGLVRTAALEGGPSNIRVNAVCPGPVDTRMLSAIEGQARPADPGSMRATIVSGVPLGRLASPDEIAAMIVFLSSTDASYCNGGTFLVDGGTTAGPFR